MSTADRERAEELAHGGIASREGDMVTLGDGVQWWLNGTQWARDEADALIVQDRARVADMRTPRRPRIEADVSITHDLDDALRRRVQDERLREIQIRANRGRITFQ